MVRRVSLGRAGGRWSEPRRPRAVRAGRAEPCRRRSGRPGGRAGFTLVEVLVAVMVFGVGVLGAVATLALSARILREAHARQTAVLYAAAVLDSLAQAERIVEGEERRARYRLRWQPVAVAGGATGVELAVEYSDGTAPRRLRFELVHLAPAPGVGDPW